MKIHHLGIVTTEIEKTLITLGLNADDISEVVEDLNQMNRLHFIYIGANDLWIELVEPMDKSSTVNNFAKKNRVGLHHIAFSGENLSILKEKISKRPQTFPLGSYEINVKSFGGHIRTMFAAFNGLLIEYVEKIKNGKK